MKKSFVFAALFALASIGLVFVGCNNGGGAAPVVPPAGGALADYAATYDSGSWSYNGSSGTSLTLGTDGTITGTKTSGSANLSITGVTVSGGGTITAYAGTLSGKYSYLYEGTNKIGLVYLTTSGGLTTRNLVLGKTQVDAAKNTFSTFYSITLDTSGMTDTYAASVTKSAS
jgi:hypothetical protein